MLNKIADCCFACLLCGLLVGCNWPKRENGPALTEQGEIYDTLFVPSGHGRQMATGFNLGKGGGVTIAPINVTIPERYAIVFKCQHGKFVIDGDQGKELYERFSKGEQVTIFYNEVFRITKESTNMVDLHFIDAVKSGLEGEKK